MQNFLLILFIGIVTICHANAYIYNAFLNFGGCQTYSVETTGQQMKFACESYNEKIGKCPTNNSEIVNICNYNELLCQGDWHCPPGFKCCHDTGVKYYNICKKAVFANSTGNDTATNKNGKANDGDKNNQKSNGNGGTSNGNGSKPNGNGNGKKPNGNGKKPEENKPEKNKPAHNKPTDSGNNSPNTNDEIPASS